MPDGGRNEIEAIVSEVFISPVRSVLLVDDEYPTLDAMLSGFIEKNDVWSKTKAKAKTNAARLEKILRYCRSPERNWMVDVHDGQNVTFAEESRFVSNLHQSDLLFLDYHLDGDGVEPEKCIKILEHLASSNHFNLVVLVTKEDPQSAFAHILPRFVQAKTSKLLTKEKNNKIEEEMGKWGDANDQIEENLTTSISLDAYLNLTSIPLQQLKVRNPKVSPYISDFITLADTKPEGIDIGKDDLLAWSLAKAEAKLGIGGTCHIEHSGLDANRYWLCCRNLFLAVYHKPGVRGQTEDTQVVVHAAPKGDAGALQSEPENIIQSLIQALINWKPTANRLILSKIRSEIEAKGLSLGDDIFTERHMQARWLSKLITASDDQQHSAAEASIGRYGEAFVSLIKDNVRDVVVRSLKIEETQNASDRIFSAFDVNLKDPAAQKRAIVEHNHIVSCQPVSGWHLQPGHILKIEQDYWVCLSPWCDLVPDRNRPRNNHLSPLMPFKAVKLRPDSVDTALDKAEENLHIFLKNAAPISGGVEDYLAFHFLVDAKANAGVHWNEFFAENQGKFDSLQKTIKVATTAFQSETGFAVPWHTAHIISQLRYEYAINLLQVLGSRTSRIGLDFIKG